MIKNDQPAVEVCNECKIEIKFIMNMYLFNTLIKFSFLLSFVSALFADVCPVESIENKTLFRSQRIEPIIIFLDLEIFGLS